MRERKQATFVCCVFLGRSGEFGIDVTSIDLENNVFIGKDKAE